MTQTLEIHHIYVGHGDATAIAIRDDLTGDYPFKMLIDASTSSGLNHLLQYFYRNFRGSEFNLAVASHYHDDHLNGLAVGIGSGIDVQYIHDIGGYDLTNIDPGTGDTIQNGAAVPNANPPQGTPDPPYTPDGSALFKRYKGALKFSALPNHTPSLQRLPVNYPANFGQGIRLGVINGVPVDLKCHAANGYVQGTVARNTGGNANNPNNYCLGFILEYGEFRYFTGGDLGGSGGSYFDHESLLAQYLAANYPNNGHVCAFKSNHHGSDHSNNTNFLTAMRPAVCVTSVGQNSHHKLPGGDFITRLNATTTLGAQQGFFFTDLVDYGGGADRLTQANGLFSARANTVYDAGGGQTFVIRVEEHANRTTQSVFSVWRGHAPNTRAKVADFNCH
jgi:hypothetical protein